MRRFFTYFSIAALFLSGLLAPITAQDFEIKLIRPVKVGERYGVQSKAANEQHMTITADGQAMPPNDEVISTVLTAKAETLGVTPGGRECKTRFTVIKFVKITGDKTEDALPPGTVLVGERPNAKTYTKTQFTIADAPVAPDMAKLLGMVISLENDQGVNDDVVFGTKEPKKVGDTWPVNYKAAALDFTAKQNILVDPANISGTATLVEQTQNGLKISANMEMKQIGFPLPPGMTVTSSAFVAKFSGVFPVDVTKRAVSSSMGIEGKVEFAGKSNGKDLAMVMTLKQAMEVTFTKP